MVFQNITKSHHVVLGAAVSSVVKFKENVYIFELYMKERKICRCVRWLEGTMLWQAVRRRCNLSCNPSLDCFSWSAMFYFDPSSPPPFHTWWLRTLILMTGAFGRTWRLAWRTHPEVAREPCTSWSSETRATCRSTSRKNRCRVQQQCSQCVL